MDLSSLKVTELRAELQKRDLQVKGLKKDLVERLQQAINNETQDQAQGQEQNTGNDADVDVDLGGAEEGGDAGEGGMEIDAPLPQDTNGRSSSPSKKTPKKSNKTGATTTTTPTPGTGKKSGGGGKKRKRFPVSAGVLGGGGEGLVKGGAAPGEGVGENQEEEVTVDAAGVAAGEVTKMIQGDDEKKEEEEEEDKRRITKNDDDEKNGSHNDGDKGETKQASTSAVPLAQPRPNPSPFTGIHSWSQLQRFIYPFPPSPPVPNSSTDTAPYSSIVKHVEDIDFSCFDDTLIDRLQSFLATFVGRFPQGDDANFPPTLAHSINIKTNFLNIQGFTLTNEQSVSMGFHRFIVPTATTILESALSNRGLNGMLNECTPSHHANHIGDLNLDLSNSLNKLADDSPVQEQRVAVEFKGPRVLLSKQKVLESYQSLTTREDQKDARAIKVKMALHMSEESCLDKIGARFGFIFGGYNAIIVERVEKDGKRGILVSKQFRIFAPPIPNLEPPDKTPEYLPNEREPEPFLALIGAALLSGAIPGEEVDKATFELPAGVGGGGGEQKDDGDGGGAEDDNDNDDDDERGGGGDGKRKRKRRNPAEATTLATDRLVSLKMASDIPREFRLHPLPPIPPPSPISSTTSHSFSPLPSPTMTWTAESPPNRSSSIESLTLRKDGESASTTQPSSSASQSASSPLQMPSSPRLTPVIELQEMVYAVEKVAVWRGTWDGLSIVVKICLRDAAEATFDNEFNVYRAVEESILSGGLKETSRFAPKFYGAFENEERSWKALVLEDVGGSLGKGFGWCTIRDEHPDLFATISANLKALHQLGFYHADLELRNIARDGRLLDFGHTVPHRCNKMQNCDEIRNLQTRQM